MVFAQRIDGDGNLLWNPGGILAASGLRYTGAPIPSVSDGTGGLITAWGQSGGGDFNLYAQRVDPVSPTASIEARTAASGFAILIAPNPSRGATAFFARSTQTTVARVAILDLQGRVVRDLGAFTLGPVDRMIHWDGLDRVSRPVESGVYFARFESREEKRILRVAIVR